MNMAKTDSSDSSFSPCPMSQKDDGPLHLAETRYPDQIKGEECPSAYRAGGYRHVKPGEWVKNGRYEIIRKLGYGEYSTVWLVRDSATDDHLAMKIFKSDFCYWDAAKQEWLASKVVHEQAQKTYHAASRHILRVSDFFEIDGSTYPNETHPCIVSELYGEHLHSLNKRIRRLGLALDIVRQIARQLLTALDFLHKECNLIHTDFKPENILVKLVNPEQIVRINLAAESTAQPPLHGNVMPSQPLKSPLPAGLSPFAACEIERERSKGSSASASPSRSPLSSLTGSSSCSSAPSFILENSTPLSEVVKGCHDVITQNIQRISLCDREELQVVLADLGSAVHDTPLKKSSKVGTREYRAPELSLGSTEWTSKVDIFAFGCTIFEIATGEPLFPKPRYRHGKRPPWPMEAESLMQMLELTGQATFPVSMLRHVKAATLLHGDGDVLNATLRRSRKDMLLCEVLEKHFSFSTEDAESFSLFLRRTLALDPESRATAAELLSDPFLSLE